MGGGKEGPRMGADRQATIAQSAQTPSKADGKLIRERIGGQVEGQDEKSLRGILGMSGCFSPPV